MKHIRYFEETSVEKKVFRISYKDITLIEACIRKINFFSEEAIKEVVQEIEDYYDLETIIGIFCFTNSKYPGVAGRPGRVESGFWAITDNESLKYCFNYIEVNEYVYMGDIYLEDWEIASIKYNL